MSPYRSPHDEWLTMKLCMYVRYHTANNVSNFGGDPVTQLHLKVIMRKRSTVLIHILSQIHSKQRFRLKMYMYIPSLLSKTCSSGIVFGKFNQIYQCTFNNLTIFNAFSYLRHVKRLGISRGRSRSIINIHEIVTSRWRIERCHRRRASGVRVKRDVGHASLSQALVLRLHAPLD